MPRFSFCMPAVVSLLGFLAIAAVAAATPAFASDGEWAEGVAIETCEDVPESQRARCHRKALAEAKAQERKLLLAVEAARAYQYDLADALARDGAPRDVAFAALLRAAAERLDEAPHSSSSELNAWRAKALAEGGDDPLVYALLLSAPPALDADDANAQARWRDEALRKWRESDPQNLEPMRLTHLRKPSPAPQSDDNGNAASKMSLDPALFVVARQATRYDTYYDDAIRLSVSAMRRHPPDAATWKRIQDSGVRSVDAFATTLGTSVWGMGLPAFQYLIAPCKGDALTLPQRQEDCRHIADVLRTRSDTLIARLIGIAVGRYAARDADEKRALTAERRVVDWQMAQWRSAGETAAEGEAANLATLVMAHPDIGESEMMLRAIEAAGLPSMPPDDWEAPFKFPDERDRSDAGERNGEPKPQPAL